VQTALVEEVATAYYDLLALDNELAILRKNINLQQDALAIIEVQKQAGRADELGVQQFNAVLHHSRGKEQEVMQQITATENHLNYLLGRFQGDIPRDTAKWMALSFTDSIIPGIPPQLLAFRPDVRQAHLELLSTDAEADAAKAAFLPTLVLSPYIGFQAFDPAKLLTTPASLAYGLLGGITAPVFNQRGIRSAYETAKAQYGIAFLNYEQTVLNAWKEVQTSLEAQAFIGKRQDHNVQEVGSLRKAVDAANELFRAGRASYLDIITAQRTVLDAEINLVKTRREKAINKLLLYKALGGGWQ